MWLCWEDNAFLWVWLGLLFAKGHRLSHHVTTLVVGACLAPLLGCRRLRLFLELLLPLSVFSGSESGRVAWISFLRDHLTRHHHLLLLLLLLSLIDVSDRDSFVLFTCGTDPSLWLVRRAPRIYRLLLPLFGSGHRGLLLLLDY